MRKSGLLIAAAILSGISTFPINAADEREGSAPVPRQANASPDSEVYRASEVIGLPVNDDKDQEVGQIKDLVINGASREVLYAVVALNDGEEKDAVYVMPWSIFQPHFGQGSALQYTILTVPQTVWIQAPYWSVTQWRQASFSQWGPRVDQYFANHIHVNSNSNNRNTFRANKPVLRDDQRKDDQRKGDPRQDSPKPRTEGRSNDDQPRKPNDANDSSTDKPKAKNPEPPKSSGKQGNPPAEQPAAKNPKLPAPKNPDPADPKDPPTPRTEKPAPKNPK